MAGSLDMPKYEQVWEQNEICSEISWLVPLTYTARPRLIFHKLPTRQSDYTVTGQ